MGKFIRAFFWLATVAAFTYNFYLWGGLAVTPAIGPRLLEQASIQTPIAASYLWFGRQSVSSLGKTSEAMAFASARFREQVTDLESPRQSIVARFLSAQSTAGTLIYYGAPILLLLSLTLHWRRPKQIRSFGRKA